MMPLLFLKRWVGWALLLALFLLVSLFFVLDRPIKKIVVLGYFNELTVSCISDALAKQIHGRYWPSSQDKLLEQAKASCPWLYGWAWHYQWPSILQIKLEENQPMLIFNGQSLMNQSEQLFMPKPLPKVLPTLSFEGPSDRFSDLLVFYKQAQPLLQMQNYSIVDLKLDPALGFEITLNNGIVLKVSAQDALPILSRFLSVDTVLFHHPHKPIQSVDLRYPHGFAVEWKS